jgi:hypothetical protein
MSTTTTQLLSMSMTPIFRVIKKWWLSKMEQHYLMCACVEQQKAKEAQRNAAYYQKRAALARSEKHSI